MGRAPHGARGLKLHGAVVIAGLRMSRPARGAWIETVSFGKLRELLMSRPARGAWIETRQMM